MDWKWVEKMDLIDQHIGGRGCFLASTSKLALRQPNSQWKNRESYNILLELWIIKHFVHFSVLSMPYSTTEL